MKIHVYQKLPVTSIILEIIFQILISSFNAKCFNKFCRGHSIILRKFWVQNEPIFGKFPLPLLSEVPHRYDTLKLECPNTKTKACVTSKTTTQHTFSIRLRGGSSLKNTRSTQIMYGYKKNRTTLAYINIHF